MKILFRLFLLVAIAAPQCRTVRADDVLALTTGSNYAPYTDESLPQGGIVTQVVVRAFQAIHQKTSIVWLPWARGYQATMDGEFAATFPYVHTADRDAVNLYSEPLITIKSTIFARPDSGVDARHLTSFENKTLCLPVGWGIDLPFNKLVEDKRMRVERPTDLSSCARMVAVGRADLFVTDVIQGRAAMRDAGVVSGEIVEGPRPFADVTMHLLAPRSDPKSAKMIERFNAGLKALKDSGAYDAIMTGRAK